MGTWNPFVKINIRDLKYDNDDDSENVPKKGICVLSNLIKLNLMERSKYAHLRISGLQIDWLVHI